MVLNREFFDAIWPPYADNGYFYEFRFIGAGKARSTFVERDQVSPYVDNLPCYPDMDVFFGVVPRMNRGGGKAEDCIRYVTAVWADIDAKKAGPKPGILDALDRLEIRPHIVVDTGGGYHGYWLLDGQYPWEDTVASMRGLAQRLNGDNVHDLPRVLRVPGLPNSKYPDTFARVILLDRLRPRYRLSDLADAFGYQAEPKRAPATARERRAGDRTPLPELPLWLSDLIHQGSEQGGRSEAIFRAYMGLIECGWGQEDIEQVMVDYPIGEKVQEMSSSQAERWMARTYRRALEYVEADV